MESKYMDHMPDHMAGHKVLQTKASDTVEQRLRNWESDSNQVGAKLTNSVQVSNWENEIIDENLNKNRTTSRRSQSQLAEEKSSSITGEGETRRKTKKSTRGNIDQEKKIYISGEHNNSSIKNTYSSSIVSTSLFVSSGGTSILGPFRNDIIEEVFLTMGLCISLDLMIINATSDDTDQLSVFACDLPPSNFGLIPLHDFTVAMTTTCSYTPECNIIAVMLIIRILIYHPQVNLKWNICRHLLLVAILVGQGGDDYPLRNVDFTTAWSRVAPDAPLLTTKNVNSLECIFLGALGFDLFIQTPQYQSFCTELCAAVNHRLSLNDGEQIKNLMQQHAMFIQNRKTSVGIPRSYSVISFPFYLPRRHISNLSIARMYLRIFYSF